MRNTLRFIGIVVLSALLMFALGSFYHFSVTKNLLLIAWSLMFYLTAFLAVYKHSKEVLTARIRWAVLALCQVHQPSASRDCPCPFV